MNALSDTARDILVSRHTFDKANASYSPDALYLGDRIPPARRVYVDDNRIASCDNGDFLIHDGGRSYTALVATDAEGFDYQFYDTDESLDLEHSKV